MSHPNSPRVNPDSAAATALSHAGDEQAHPTPAASSAGNASPETIPLKTDSPAAAVSQAQQWLQGIRLPASLRQVPAPLQRLATQTGNGWRHLSTPQKVAAGALLAVGGWFLLRPGKAKAARSRGATSAGTLHELLLFVNDRIAGYKRAAGESQDADLRNYYQQLADQSHQFADRLNGYLRVQDGGEETGTTLKGKLYRAWMEAKAAVTGYSETAVLGSNVYGEEWALKAYEEALQDRTLTGSLRREVQRQYEQSQQTHRKLQQRQAQY